MNSYSVPSLMLSVIMLLSLSMAASQNVKVNWYTFNGGFVVPSGPNTVVKSSAGQMVVGSTHQSNNFLESGFLVNPLLRGTLVNVGENRELPLSYSLSQNYPNPFNPSTKIGFQIADYGFVTLKVYDVLGREVATLVNGVEDPGYKSVQWNASNAASGVYFYRLEAGSFTSVKKLLLLR